MKNLGYYFYKDYYKSYSEKGKVRVFDPRKFFKELEEEKALYDAVERTNKDFFISKNRAITDCNLSYDHVRMLDTLNEKNIPFYSSFSLKTTYPGLLLGSGYVHETGSEGEFKLGFYFDHTTGLPLIPGSSIKGILRSAFKQVVFVGQLVGINKEEVNALELEIFEGVDVLKTKSEDLNEKHRKNWKYLNPYKRDIFYDAIPIKSMHPPIVNQHEGRLLDEDYITPHINRENPKLSPFSDPTPLLFLKILPDVVFKFRFSLQNGHVFKEQGAFQKKELFEAILLWLGTGAKTHVGYGQWDIAE